MDLNKRITDFFESLHDNEWYEAISRLSFSVIQRSRIENCPQNRTVVPITDLDHSYNDAIDGAREEKDGWKTWII